MSRNILISLLITYLAISQVESAPEEFIKKIAMSTKNGRWRCASYLCSERTIGCAIKIEKNTLYSPSRVVKLYATCIGGEETHTNAFKLQDDRDIRISLISTSHPSDLRRIYSPKGFEGVYGFINLRDLNKLRKFIKVNYNVKARTLTEVKFKL